VRGVLKNQTREAQGEEVVKDETRKPRKTGRRSLEEIEKILDEDAAFDEAAAVEAMSDEALEREVAGAGIDLEKMKAKALATGSRPPPAGAERPRRGLVAAALNERARFVVANRALSL
jgi:hypothetical protein